MSITVCLLPTGTLDYPNGGGYRWIYLNWALGLRALGCRVIWLEGVNAATPEETIRTNAEDAPFTTLAHWYAGGGTVDWGVLERALT